MIEVATAKRIESREDLNGQLEPNPLGASNLEFTLRTSR